MWAGGILALLGAGAASSQATRRRKRTAAPR
jgi:hypothetical protein